MSVGIEDISDIIADFSHAFSLAIPDENVPSTGHPENQEPAQEKLPGQ